MRNQTPATATDLYELTMAAGYWAANRTESATFELFTRRLPRDRSFLVAAGLEAACEYLENLRFAPEEIQYLRGLRTFARAGEGFFRMLAELRFTGDAWAVPEGTVVFPFEPLLVVRAPIIEAQLVETALLALVNFPTSVASKAARVATAAAPARVVEFGARRAHGTEAALIASRAAYVGGCAGTSNVEAGARYGITVSGTLAHAWIMSFDDEVEAFRAYQRAFPDNAIFLIDTYDTVRAARAITRAFRPGEVAGVRIDSGDIGALARDVRAVLDAAGFVSTKILASGDLNEWSIRDLLAAGAPIDVFGVGTDLTTVRDAPSLGGVYKLVEIDRDGRPELKMKLSEGKSTYPGRKQIWRLGADAGEEFAGDTLALWDEPAPAAGATPLLEHIVAAGRRLAPPPPLEELRARSRRQVERLPARLRALEPSDEPYPVGFSDALLAAQRAVRERETTRNRD